MVRKPAIHTVKRDDSWVNVFEGIQNALSVSDTQANAVQLGKSLAKFQATEHFIHGRDGRIRERNSYGNDPFPPQG